MLTPRDQFLNQFASTILIHAIQRWQCRLIAPPECVPSSLYDAMRVCNGTFSVMHKEFYSAIWPLLVATHEAGRKSKARRPDRSQFENRLYDVLSQAGIKVTIGPPLEAHGGPYGGGKHI